MTANPSKYWTDHRLRIEGRGPAGPFVVALNTPYALIGTHESAHVQLHSLGVIRRHLFALATDEGIYLVNFLEGRRQNQQNGSWLKSNDVIHVGEHELRLGFNKQELPTTPPSVGLFARSASRPFPMMRCRTGEGVIGRPYLNRPLAIAGRRTACKFQFTTRTISPEHCAFYQQDGQLWVIDFQTTGKTKKDNIPIDCALLEHGSRVQIGRVRIKVYMGQTKQQQTPKHLSLENNTESSSPRNTLESAKSNPPTSPKTDQTVHSLDSTLDVNELASQDESLNNPNHLPQSTTVSFQNQHEQLLDQLKTSHAEIDDLTTQLAASQADLKTYQSELAALRELLNESLADAEQLKTTRNVIEADLRQKSNDHEKSLTDLNTANSQLSAMQDERDNAIQKLADSQQEINEMQNRLAMLQLEFEASQLEVTDLRETCDATKRWQEAHLESQANFERQAEDLKSAIQQYEIKRDEIELREQEVKLLQIHLNEQEKGCESRERELKQRLTILDEKALSIEEDKAELATERQAFQSTLAQLEHDQAALNRNQHRIDEMEGALNEQRQHHEHHMAQQDARQKELEEKQAALEQQATSIAEQRQHHEHHMAQQDARQKELEEKQAVLEQQAISIADQRQTLQNETQETEERLKKTADQLEQQKSDLAHEIARLEEQKHERQLEEETTKITRGAQPEEGMGKAQDRQQMKQDLLSTKEEELIARERTIAQAEERVQADRQKIEADRKELGRYFQIDSTQRQVLANLNSIQKEKSLSNRIWSWFGFPFRKDER